MTVELQELLMMQNLTQINEKILNEVIKFKIICWNRIHTNVTNFYYDAVMDF